MCDSEKILYIAMISFIHFSTLETVPVKNREIQGEPAPAERSVQPWTQTPSLGGHLRGGRVSRARASNVEIRKFSSSRGVISLCYDYCLKILFLFVLKMVGNDLYKAWILCNLFQLITIVQKGQNACVSFVASHNFLYRKSF